MASRSNPHAFMVTIDILLSCSEFAATFRHGKHRVIAAFAIGTGFRRPPLSRLDKEQLTQLERDALENTISDPSAMCLAAAVRWRSINSNLILHR